MPYKVIMGWGFSGVGPYRPAATEVHWYLGAAASAQALNMNLNIVQLMNARTQLMGSNITALLYRVSVPGLPRDTWTVYATPTANQVSPLCQTAAISQGPSERANSALKITLGSAQGNRRNMYMAGLPDALFQFGGVVGPNFGAAGLTNYQGLFKSWLSVLEQSIWGFECLNPLPGTQPQAISFWVQMGIAPFNLAFVIPNTAPNSWNAGQVVHVRSVLMGVTGVPRPIGRWRIKSVSAYDANNTQYELDQSSAYQATLIQEPGTVEDVTFGFQPYTQDFNYLQTTRKRGVGPVRPRGRQKRPVRRQPV